MFIIDYIKCNNLHEKSQLFDDKNQLLVRLLCTVHQYIKVDYNSQVRTSS